MCVQGIIRHGSSYHQLLKSGGDLEKLLEDIGPILAVLAEGPQGPYKWTGSGEVFGGSWSYFGHSGRYGYYHLKVLEKVCKIHLFKIQKSWI